MSHCAGRTVGQACTARCSAGYTVQPPGEQGFVCEASGLLAGTAVDCREDCGAFPELPTSTVVTGESSGVTVAAYVAAGEGRVHRAAGRKSRNVTKGYV